MAGGNDLAGVALGMFANVDGQADRAGWNALTSDIAHGSELLGWQRTDRCFRNGQSFFQGGQQFGSIRAWNLLLGQVFQLALRQRST